MIKKEETGNKIGAERREEKKREKKGRNRKRRKRG